MGEKVQYTVRITCDVYVTAPAEADEAEVGQMARLVTLNGPWSGGDGCRAAVGVIVDQERPEALA